MVQKKKLSDQEILAELRKPIDELIGQLFGQKTELEKIRLRQLAWQAVDVLVKINNVRNLENEKEITRIIQDIRQLGASQEFIDKSLDLAIEIYHQIQLEHPGLLERYQG